LNSTPISSLVRNDPEATTRGREERKLAVRRVSKAGAAVLKCREALAEAEDALGKTLRAAKEMFDAGGGGGGGGGGVGGGAA